MEDVISREEIYSKIYRMKDRIRSHREGSYRRGYTDACKDAFQKLGECASLEVVTVTRCRYCRHAAERETTLPYCTVHNRRRAPDDYCKCGEREETEA